MKKLSILCIMVLALLITACPDVGENTKPTEPRVATDAEVKEAVALASQSSDVTQEIYGEGASNQPVATRFSDSYTFKPEGSTGDGITCIFAFNETTGTASITMKGNITMNTGTPELGIITMNTNMTTIVRIDADISDPEATPIFTMSYVGYSEFTAQETTERIEYKNFSIDFANSTITGEILYTTETGEVVRITEEQLNEHWEWGTQL